MFALQDESKLGGEKQTSEDGVLTGAYDKKITALMS